MKGQLLLVTLLRVYLSVRIFAVSIVERSIAAGFIAAWSVVSDFIVVGLFVAEYIVCGVHIC